MAGQSFKILPQLGSLKSWKSILKAMQALYNNTINDLSVLKKKSRINKLQNKSFMGLYFLAIYVSRFTTY